jgi:hypothetical protein
MIAGRAAVCVHDPSAHLGLLAVCAWRTYLTTEDESDLAALLPRDLDLLEDTAVMGELCTQLLLFGGFLRSSRGWVRDRRPPTTLSERADRIRPGHLNYSFLPENHHFGGCSAVGATVGSVARSLTAIGVRPSDFDGAARSALEVMLSWQLPGRDLACPHRAPPTSGTLTLLVFSFGATRECRTALDCARPGPTNELLAVTAWRFAARRMREHGQRVDIIAQWEVAAALRNIGGEVVAAVGTPGRFENTSQIFHRMKRAMADEACRRGSQFTRAAIVLTHPDHLYRALRIGQTTFTVAAVGRVGGGGSSCDGAVRLWPAMLPFDLGWPETVLRGQSGQSVVRELNLYHLANASATVHVAGSVELAAWQGDGAISHHHGYFADGHAPGQEMVHRREVWLAFELFARADGIASGTIALYA